MTIKTICLNLWIGGKLFDAAVDFLEKEAADVLLLQEVFNGKNNQLDPQYRSLSALKTQLNYPHHHFAPAFLEDVGGQKIEQGNAILSKFPLTEVATIFYDQPFGIRDDRREAYPFTPRNLQHVVADINEAQLHLLNTQGIWGEHGRDTPRRLAMGDIIVDEFKAHQPVLLAGDFNVESDTQTIAKIENHLTNIFKDKLTTSFNLERKNLEQDPGYANSVVDMIFVSDDITVTNHYCPDVDVSDHLPLVAELEL